MFKDESKAPKQRKKILIKGEPGMGKTTLGKKMGFDWVKGVFKMFSVIFFLTLRLAKPGSSIEKVILQQHPELEALKMSEQRVQTLLNKFGDRCLLILDGLDEYGLGQSGEILKVIRNRVLLNCGVLVTSRPHTTREFQNSFPTIVRVDGFTEEEAKKFVAKFFTDEIKIRQIMLFKPSDSREDAPVHKCPILLSFLCLLVKEDEINLLDTKLTIGDLYLRMVQCLYKKFTIRKDKTFENSEFVQVLKSVGRLALQTLQSNNPLLQRSEVLRIVGKSAFEYGFFAGHEDFRLATDPTADICVTYPHRSLEEFFGSFGFLQTLNDGKSVDDILGSDCEQAIFMMNPLVIKFCLWFFTTKFLSSRETVYDKLAACAAQPIDSYFLETSIVGLIYPAMNIEEALLSHDRLKLDFFKHIFEKCQHVRVFHIGCLTGRYIIPKFFRDKRAMAFSCEIESTLGITSKLLSKLTLLSISDHNTLPLDINSNDFAISIDCMSLEHHHIVAKMLLTNSHILQRNPQMYVKIECDKSHDLTTLIQQLVKELNLVGENLHFTGKNSLETLSVSNEFPHCPQLTHFTAKHYAIDDSVPTAFMKAVRDGKFPNLRRIELISCTMNDCEWPEVPEFSLKTVEMPDISQMQNILPKLTELSLNESLNIDSVFLRHLENLSVLKVKATEICDLQRLNDILKKGKLPHLSELFIKTSKTVSEAVRLHTFLYEFEPHKTVKLEKLVLQRFIISVEELTILSQKLVSVGLTELDMTGSSGFTGSLSVLFPHSFPGLKALILESCKLNKEDIRALCQANVEGKLPQLEHLNILENRDVEISDLFTNSSQWNQLKTLTTNDANVLNVESEFLDSLEKLYCRKIKQPTLSVKRRWCCLKVIQMDDPDIIPNIADGAERGMFPALTTVRLKSDGYTISDKMPSSLFKLFQANILFQNIP